MSTFAYFETEAVRLATRIRELKAATPDFVEARDTAQRHVERHYGLIEEAEEALSRLREEAATAAAGLGSDILGDVPELAPRHAELPALDDLTETEQAEVEAVLNDDTPFEGCAQADPIDPRQGSDVIAELIRAREAEIEADNAEADPFVPAPETGFADIDNATAVSGDPPADTFVTLGEVAEQITAAVAEIASPSPPTPDASDDPEMTDEQVERVEQNFATAYKAFA